MPLRLSKSKIVLYSSHNLSHRGQGNRQVSGPDQGRNAQALRQDGERAREVSNCVGIKASGDLSGLAGVDMANGYYIFRVAAEDEVGAIVRKLVTGGATVTEVRELRIPSRSSSRGACGWGSAWPPPRGASGSGSLTGRHLSSLRHLPPVLSLSQLLNVPTHGCQPGSTLPSTFHSWQCPLSA